MKGLKSKKYLNYKRKGFDPVSIVIGTLGLGVVFFLSFRSGGVASIVDIRSIGIVVGGTLASLFIQFDTVIIIRTLYLLSHSLWTTPGKQLEVQIKELDRAILKKESLTALRDAHHINGELLNDVVYMHLEGLHFEEINTFVVAKVRDEMERRKESAELLKKAGVIAPSLGLLGTVLGLVGVLKNLNDPSEIGPSMSLALLTTAYGAVLGSLIFQPLAGRLENHNQVYKEACRDFLVKAGVLIHRDERELSEGV